MASAAPTAAPPPRRKSIFALLAEIPTLVTDLVQREINLLKTEIITKLKALGAGVGVLAGAALVLLAMVGVLLTAAVFALSLVLPGWAAALVVAGALLIVAAILGLIGYRILKKGFPPFPSESIDSIRRDLRAIKGTGKRAKS
ncbi:MAG: phage holin family protein [Pseudolysinimonas sp.]|uniref:phage holin family protein n=1 Tax=Pseudolysinimonas sp. TaxID=2680009 RepID=UPI0032672602